MTTSNEVTKSEGVFIDFCKALSTSDQQALGRFLGEVNSKNPRAEVMLSACAEGKIELGSVLSEFKGVRGTNTETRVVSRKHAELALSEALFRMSAAINQAQVCDLEDPEEAFALGMLMESAARAAGIAIEVSDILGIGRPEADLNARECYQEWCDWLHTQGPQLTLEEEPAAA